MKRLNHSMFGLLAILMSVSCAKEAGDEAANSDQMIAKETRIVYYAIPG